MDFLDFDSSARQGDVLIERVDAMPEGLVAIKKDAARDGFVLAEGEVTGHAHALCGDAIETYAKPQAKEPNTMDVSYFMLRADEKQRGEALAYLKHEEHQGHVFKDPGVYKVTRQREYTAQGLRNVAD